MIVETNANQIFKVREIGDAALAHLWYGLPGKIVRGAFVPKKNAREQLVSKAHVFRTYGEA